eukprot:Gregarina_sp_Poly_1__414@NODE_10_length_23460_cov_121_463087_g8_i1_p17_GENE_NODE_10_length_23460_cov_121_463087_g8_i1NODE_10_length_23460_cov_121_463087_g8_i1_p17_ORF_typecomplete_len158_score20_82SQAPI/PF16845_5/0_098_NODE_10_length_23460_cov_121_463087_g8_i133543827
MKFFIPVLACAAAAEQNDLARAIAHRVAEPMFPGYVARRVGSLRDVSNPERIAELANLATVIFNQICMDTFHFLQVNNGAEQILQQIDGVALTIDARKKSVCNNYFADFPTPCHQVVDASSSWCTARLCDEFSEGLNPERAMKYGVCADWMPTARII